MALPTNAEQEMLELINRARANPAGEFGRIVLSTNPVTGVTADVTSALTFFNVNVSLFQQQIANLPSAPPLAWSTNLEDAASQHSTRMIQGDSQSHQLPGEPDLGQRATNNGYTFSSLGENIFAFSDSAVEGHAAFFVDWGNGPGGMQSPAGHRASIVNAGFTEIGIDITPESNPATQVGPLVITQDFGNRFNYAPQVVGVVFADADSDNFYDAGEGRGGVTVTAVGTGGTFTTTTWSSGGYQFAAPAGTYTVTFAGGGIATKTASVTIGNTNVKLDYNAAAAPNLNDTFISNASNQTFNGAAGDDTAVFQGTLASHTVTRSGASIIVTDSVANRDGMDTLISVEHLRFADRSIDLTMAAKALQIGAAQLNALIELYVAYFNRVPEAGGLAFWIDRALNGESLAQISQEFYAAGVQFSSVTGYSATMPNGDFIKIVYANVLGRTGNLAPPVADVQFWDDRIASGTVTREGLIQKMLSDARLFAGDPTWGWVTTLLDNKIAVGNYHAVQLGLDYASPTAAITSTQAIAAAVTPTGTNAAIQLIGLADSVFL